MPQMLEARGYGFKPNGDSEVDPIRDSFVVGALLSRLRSGAGVPLGGMRIESLWLAWLCRWRLAVVVDGYGCGSQMPGRILQGAYGGFCSDAVSCYLYFYKWCLLIQKRRLKFAFPVSFSHL